MVVFCRLRVLVVLLLLPLLAWGQVDESAATPLYPSGLVTLSSNYALIAELEAGKLHLFQRTRDGLVTPVTTMDMSIGKEGYGKQIEGDNKTPVGVYRIVSHLTNEQLDDYYGHAAYPVNYPNVWDKRHGRTGYGIWLHAEPVGFTVKTRPLLDSNGCVVVSNNDIDSLHQYLDIGHTTIIMTPRVQWVEAGEITSRQQILYQQLAIWKQAWESLESEPYLNFYSKDFNNLEKDWYQWVDYKQRVNSNKSFINVDYSDVGIYQYPGEQALYWVEFYQSYRSNNYQSQGWKQQLWKLENDNQWRIIYEGGG